ncbi:MAG TPA: acyltransferase [Xanthobacteraceae bacterium]|jgi:peptidoglycan/LPS O-acetylase OafA/YrhL|nr:acyltransferase [Xanthobacteraceae bacterium]
MSSPISAQVPRSAQSSSAANGQLPSLTPLRGIAALWVVIYHYTTQCFPDLDVTAHTAFIHKGYLAVDMFFMLSGFVMTHVYCRAFNESVTKHYGSFLMARVARIYPLHLLILILFVVTAVASRWHGATPLEALRHVPLHGPESVSAFFANIFMLQGLNAGALSWNYPSWSISVEFMAYLLFPFALPLIWHASARMKIAIAAVLFGALALLAYITGDSFDQWDGPITLLRCLPEFALGTLLYCAFRAAPEDSLLSRDTFVFGVLATIIVCLHYGVSDFLMAGLFAAFVLAAVLNSGSFSRLANTPALIWLGDISFALYLIHSLVQFIVSELLWHFGIKDHAAVPVGISIACTILMIGVCLVASHLSYFGVEIPCRRYLRDVFAGGKRQPAWRASLRSWPRIVVPENDGSRKLATVTISRLIPPSHRR